MKYQKNWSPREIFVNIWISSIALESEKLIIYYSLWIAPYIISIPGGKRVYNLLSLRSFTNEETRIKSKTYSQLVV